MKPESMIHVLWSTASFICIPAFECNYAKEHLFDLYVLKFHSFTPSFVCAPRSSLGMFPWVLVFQNFTEMEIHSFVSLVLPDENLLFWVSPVWRFTAVSFTRIEYHYSEFYQDRRFTFLTCEFLPDENFSVRGEQKSRWILVTSSWWQWMWIRKCMYPLISNCLIRHVVFVGSWKVYIKRLR